MGQLVGVIAVICVFGIPLSAIWSEHRRKMLELQLRLKKEGDVGLRAAVDALREEVRSLRDTSTQYDLSFDSALQRMEQRVERLEHRTIAQPNEDTVNLRVGK